MTAKRVSAELEKKYMKNEKERKLWGKLFLWYYCVLYRIENSRNEYNSTSNILLPIGSRVEIFYTSHNYTADSYWIPIRSRDIF